MVLLLAAATLVPAYALADKGDDRDRKDDRKRDREDKKADKGDRDEQERAPGTAGTSSPLSGLLERVRDELTRAPVEVPEGPDDDDDAAKDVRAAPEEASALLPAVPKPPRDLVSAGNGVVAYALSGVGGILLLGLALVVARRAARPRHRLPRRGAAAARARALKAAPADADGVVKALRDARYGKLLHAHVGAADAELSLRRKRGVSCAEVESYLTGLLESTWGHDVDVEHVECAGKRRGPCAFRARARAAPGR